MKLKLKFSLFIILLFSTLGFAQEFPEAPNPPRLVNDFVGILTPEQTQTLEHKLVGYNDTTSTQVSIVIVKSVKPYEISDYAYQLGRKWGVGQKGKNNGVMILWATDDRKVWIATGYGMEGVLPDYYCQEIISRNILPNFKASQYYEGLDQGTTEIFRHASGEYKADPKSDDDNGLAMFLLILALIILFIWLSRRSGGNGGRGLRDSGSAWPYATYTGWGSQSGSWGGGGGSGGGGFGGFGGGSFGGGGAGGDY